MGRNSRKRREQKQTQRQALAAQRDGTDATLGSVAVLNVGAGDLTLTFAKDKPDERERAARIVTDMLRRGYAILVQVGVQDGEPVYMRAKSFDPERCEYVVVGAPDDAVAGTPAAKVVVGEVVDAPEGTETPRRRGQPRGATTRRIPAETTRTVAVARSAGG